MNSKLPIDKSILIFIIIINLCTISFAQGPAGYKGIHQQHLETFGKKIPDVVDLLKTADVIPFQRRLVEPNRFVVGYHPYWNNGLQTRYKWELLTVVNYFGVSLRSNGTISTTNSWPYNSLINAAHNNGVKAQLVVTLFSANDLTTLLGSPAYRTQAINNIVDLMVDGNGDGIDIDFEGVPASRRSHLVTFMSELRTALDARDSNYTLSMASPAVDWRAAWDYNALADICDWLFIMGYNYYYSGSSTSGPVAPLKLNSGWHLTRSVNDYLTKTGSDTSKLILGLPYYGIKWPTTTSSGYSSARGRGSSIFYKSAKSEGKGFGQNWDNIAKSPWYSYNSNGWYVAWYDDEIALSHKYAMATNKKLKGIGMWALGYDDGFTELWDTLYSHFGTNKPPKTPVKLRVETDVNNGDIVVSLKPDSGAISFDYYMSTDAENFRFIGNSLTPNFRLTNVNVDSIYFFKAVGRNQFGASPETETLAARPGLYPNVLIVNGFDREEGIVPANSRDYIIKYAKSLNAASFEFNSTSNEVVESGEIHLEDYEFVIWILGNESVETKTLSNLEQVRIKSYLRNGGKLFISGSDIGLDLVENGNLSSKAFYEDYLKAKYIKNDVGDSSTVFSSNALQTNNPFTGLSTIEFDDGTKGTYKVDSPDGIMPVPSSGAELVLSYSEVDPDVFGGAGIVYTGIFSNSNQNGALVYFSFPFETITNESMRDDLIFRIFNYFINGPVGIEDKNNPEIPESYSLEQNYPNPFNPSTTINFALIKSSKVKLFVYNILGQKISSLIDKFMPAGRHKIDWNGRDDFNNQIGSGIYVYILKAEQFTLSKKMILLN